jgi:hypothetical protein
MTPISGGSSLTYNRFTGLVGVSTSSLRYKKDIHPIPPQRVADVLKLEPVAFTYKENGMSTFGLIAEDVHKVFPELAPVDEHGVPYTVHYELLSVLLLQHVKRMDAELALLKNEYAQLASSNK